MGKFAAPSRALLYSLDGVPWLVDVVGRGDYFPAVFALWHAPELLPQIFVKHAGVTQFLIGELSCGQAGLSVGFCVLPALSLLRRVVFCIYNNLG